jgi:hypothetical protein
MEGNAKSRLAVPVAGRKATRQDERLVIWIAAGIVMYSCTKTESGMPRAGTIIALLVLTVILAGCSKCASPFGSPGACHRDAPSTG